MSSLKRTFMAAAAVLVLTAPVAFGADLSSMDVVRAGAECGPACVETLVQAVEAFHQQTDPALCDAPEVRLGRTVESCQQMQLTFRAIGYAVGGLAGAGYLIRKMSGTRQNKVA